MNVFFAVDMEGATGVVHREQLMPEGKSHAAACKLLTGDVNAAIDGVVQALGDTAVGDVLVNDGHGIMRNVVLEQLHERARLILGPASNKPLCQCEGIDDRFDAAIFVGFHSRAGTKGGLLSHTFVGRVIHELTLNGNVVGEAGMDAAICGHYGVPVLLVTGSAELKPEVEATVGKHVRFVATKEPLGTSGAACLPPARTEMLIREAAREAIRAFATDPAAFPVKRVAGPIVIGIETHHRDMTRDACVVDGIERMDDRRFEATADDVPTAFRRIWKAIEYTMREYPPWLA